MALLSGMKRWFKTVRLGPYYSRGSHSGQLVNTSRGSAYYDATGTKHPNQYSVGNCLGLEKYHPLGSYPHLVRVSGDPNKMEYLPEYVMYTPDSVDLNPTEISVAKLAALTKLVEYREKWSKARGETIAYIHANYRKVFMQYIVYTYRHGGSSSSGNDYTSQTTTYNQTQAVVATSDLINCWSFMREPSWLALELEIEAFYGNLMDLAQNAVIQQMIDKDPTLHWAGEYAINVGMADILRDVTSHLWPTDAVAQSNPYKILKSKLVDLTIEEKLPDEINSEDLIGQLVANRISWLQVEIEELMVEGELILEQRPDISSLVTPLIREIQAAVVDQLRSHFTSKPYWAEVAKLLTEHTSADVAALLLDLEFKPSLVDEVTMRAADAILAAGLEGGEFDRPTIILSPPGCEQEFVSALGAIPFASIAEVQALGSFKGKIKNIDKAIAPAMHPIICHAAKGHLVCGHVGSGLLQSFVVSAKSYGCNVIIHSPTFEQVKSGITLARSKGRPIFIPANVSGMVTTPLVKATQHWHSLSHISSKETARTVFATEDKEASFEKDSDGVTAAVFMGFDVLNASGDEITTLLAEWRFKK